MWEVFVCVCVRVCVFVCMCVCLATHRARGLFVYCCDFSQAAVDLVRSHPEYNEERCHAFVADISNPNTRYPFPEHSLDVITLIFVLSAVKPEW